MQNEARRKNEYMLRIYCQNIYLPLRIFMVKNNIGASLQFRVKSVLMVKWLHRCTRVVKCNCWYYTSNSQFANLLKKRRYHMHSLVIQCVSYLHQTRFFTYTNVQKWNSKSSEYIILWRNQNIDIKSVHWYFHSNKYFCIVP